MHEVWGDTIVEETNLTTNISLLRKALGEKRDEHNYIVTIPGEGYRFVADVRSGVVSGPLVIRERTRTAITLEEEETDDSAGVDLTRLSAKRKARPALMYLIPFSALLIAFAVYFIWVRQTERNTQSKQIKSIAVLPSNHS